MTLFCSHNLVTRGQQPNLVTGATQRTVLRQLLHPSVTRAGTSIPHKPRAAGGQEEPPQLAARGNVSAFRLLLGCRTTEDDVPLSDSKVCPIQHCKTTVAAGKSSREGARTWAGAQTPHSRAVVPEDTHPRRAWSCSTPLGSRQSLAGTEDTLQAFPHGSHVCHHCRAQCDSSASHPTSQGPPES